MFNLKQMAQTINFLTENNITDYEKLVEKTKAATDRYHELSQQIKDLEKRMAEKEAALVADQTEVMKYLTSVLRGQSQSEVVVVEGVGEGCSEARTMQKAPDEKERLKAAELLGKAHMIFTDKVQQEIDMDLNITVDYGDEE